MHQVCALASTYVIQTVDFVPGAHWAPGPDDLDARLVKSSTPVWFGAADRPLLGWIDRPADGRARGGVVLCPPMGVELNFSQYILRVLAGELVEAGFVALRFDYDGTGQSAGETNDPERVSAWLASISYAVEHVRATGVPWVGAIGLRLGATLLANAAVGGCSLDALLLWDPCLSGRSFLREQTALQSSVSETPLSGPDGTEIPGYLILPATIAELGGLELPEDLAPRSRAAVVALLDPARPQNGRVRRRLGADIDWREYAASADIFDIGERVYEFPTAVVDQLVECMEESCAERTVELTTSSPEPRCSVVAHTGEGRPILETVLELGPTGLVGIECQVLDPGRSGDEDLPVVLFVSMAAEPSIGPARQWVDLSRRWAADGYRSVRLDLSGIGESPTRPGRRERHIYAPWALDDIAEAAHAVSPSHPQNVVLVGVCSGAYMALAVAPHLRPRGVVAINPLLTFGAFEGWEPSLPGEDGQAPARIDQNARRAANDLARRMLTAINGRGRGNTYRRGVANRLPPALWTVVYALRLAHSPARLIAPVVRAGVSTIIICGQREATLPQARVPSAIAQLSNAPGSDFAVIPDLDHSLRDESSRAAARRTMTEFIADVSRPDASGRRPSPTSADAGAQTRGGPSRRALRTRTRIFLESTTWATVSRSATPAALRLRRRLTAPRFVKQGLRCIGRLAPDSHLMRSVARHVSLAEAERELQEVFWARMKGGLRIAVTLTDLPSCLLYFCGGTGRRSRSGWEPDTAAFVSDWLRPGDTVLDVGANVGYYTLIAAAAVGPAGRVFAFEPFDTPAELLERTVEANHLQRQVSVVRSAVTDRTGEVVFHPGTVSTSNTIVASPSVAAEHGVAVSGVCLDDFADSKRLTCVRLVKIDAEGAEPLIVSGAQRFLSSVKPDAVILEFNRDTAGAAGQELWRDLIGPLEHLDYRPFIPRDDGRLTPAGDAPDRVWGNVVFVHEDVDVAARLTARQAPVRIGGSMMIPSCQDGRT